MGNDGKPYCPKEAQTIGFWGRYLSLGQNHTKSIALYCIPPGFLCLVAHATEKKPLRINDSWKISPMGKISYYIPCIAGLEPRFQVRGDEGRLTLCKQARDLIWDIFFIYKSTIRQIFYMKSMIFSPHIRFTLCRMFSSTDLPIARLPVGSGGRPMFEPCRPSDSGCFFLVVMGQKPASQRYLQKSLGIMMNCGCLMLFVPPSHIIHDSE